MNFKIIQESISMSANSLQLTLKALFVDEVNPSTTNAYSPHPRLSLSINKNP